MRSFVVHGSDLESGAPICMTVSLGSVGEAADFVTKRGVIVSSIHAPSGHVLYPVEGGGFRRDDEGSPHSKLNSPDTALLVFAFLIPFVGIIAGAIRLARRDPSGGGVLITALLGSVAWLVIVAATVSA